MPKTAMLLAAGLATRMRPLTDDTPKPLLKLGGLTLLDHALARLVSAGVTSAVINAHWHAAKIEAFVEGRRALPPALHLQMEPALLETGGSVQAALPLLGPDPFYVVNGDAFWLDGTKPALSRLAAVWGEDVDAVLLVHRTCQIEADTGFGDFFLDPMGAVRRRGEQQVAPYLYAGVQLMSPALLAGAAAGRFSMNPWWDRAIAAGRLRAVVHDGLWFHLSTPRDLAETEHFLAHGFIGEPR